MYYLFNVINTVLYFFLHRYIDDFGRLEFMWVLYFTKYIFIPKKHDRNGRLIREVEIDEIRLIGISSKYKFVV